MLHQLGYVSLPLLRNATVNNIICKTVVILLVDMLANIVHNYRLMKIRVLFFQLTPLISLFIGLKFFLYSLLTRLFMKLFFLSHFPSLLVHVSCKLAYSHSSFSSYQSLSYLFAMKITLSQRMIFL